MFVGKNRSHRKVDGVGYYKLHNGARVAGLLRAVLGARQQCNWHLRQSPKSGKQDPSVAVAVLQT